jgi:HAE1 family hydrophobic/amphiphilic exporter-1
VILIVPMCLLAAVSGLLLRGMSVDILAQIGFVVLVALASKNAILIVEFTKQAQEEGACGLPFRPSSLFLPKVMPHPAVSGD